MWTQSIPPLFKKIPKWEALEKKGSPLPRNGFWSRIRKPHSRPGARE
jgi:hypothetical protein